jgi:S-adenosylmethionine:diacylglycerol 3-amino-3-carboxypropyl transferase
MEISKKLPVGLFAITEGPAKFDLMISLFDGKVVQITVDVNASATTSANLKVAASFKIFPKLEVVFQSIGAEDGSRDSWIGEVYFVGAHYENVRRRYYYNTRTRKGHICEAK